MDERICFLKIINFRYDFNKKDGTKPNKKINTIKIFLKHNKNIFKNTVNKSYKNIFKNTVNNFFKTLEIKSYKNIFKTLEIIFSKHWK